MLKTLERLSHRLRNLWMALLDNPFPPFSQAFFRYAAIRLRLGADRYNDLLKLIATRRCRTLVEIGTNRGENAARMIRVAQLASPGEVIAYHGFDLFEELTDEKCQSEYSLVPLPEDQVRRRLEVLGAEVHLYKGDTRNTLQEARSGLAGAEVDLIYVDGGHSLDTVASDWERLEPLVSERTTVLFDDYYSMPEEFGWRCGCRTLLSGLDPTKYEVEVLKLSDRFEREFGTLEIRFGQVRLRSGPV